MFARKAKNSNLQFFFIRKICLSYEQTLKKPDFISMAVQLALIHL